MNAGVAEGRASESPCMLARGRTGGPRRQGGKPLAGARGARAQAPPAPRDPRHTIELGSTAAVQRQGPHGRGSAPCAPPPAHLVCRSPPNPKVEQGGGLATAGRLAKLLLGHCCGR